MVRPMLSAIVAAAALAAAPAVPASERPARAAAAVQLTVAASGDFLIHEPVWERARDLLDKFLSERASERLLEA